MTPNVWWITAAIWPIERLCKMYDPYWTTGCICSTGKWTFQELNSCICASHCSKPFIICHYVVFIILYMITGCNFTSENVAFVCCERVK